MKLTNNGQGRTSTHSPQHSTSAEPQYDPLPHLSLKKTPSDRPSPSPLRAHKIHIQKVNTGLKGIFGRGLRVILTPIINKVIENGYKARARALKESCEYFQNETKAASEQLTFAKKQLAEADKAVNHLFHKISNGQPVPHNELRNRLAEIDTKVLFLSTSQDNLNYYSKSQAEAEKKLKTHLKTGRVVTNSLKSNTDTLVKLATDLRSAFSAHKSKSSQSTAYQISLPCINVVGEDVELIALQNLNLVIDDMGLSESGDFTFNVLSASVQASTAIAGLAKPPVSFQGRCKLVIKAPLGESFAKMLSCGVHEVIGNAGLFSEALETALNEAEANPLSPIRLSAFIGIEVPDIGISKAGQTHALFTRQATDILLNTFSPIIGMIKHKSDKGTIERLEAENTVSRQYIQTHEDSENSLRHIKLEVHQCLERIRSQSTATDKALVEELQTYSASCERKLRILESQITQEKGKLKNKMRLLKHCQRRLKASESTTEATIKNSTAGLMALREAVAHKNFPAQSIKLTPVDQHISLTDTADASLKSCSINLQAVTLDSAGELQIQLHDSSAQVDIHSAQKQCTPLGTLWMKDVTISIHPPLGGVLHKILTLSPPFSLQEIEKLHEQYHRLTTENQSFTDHLSIQIGQAGRQKPADATVSKEEADHPLNSIPDLELTDRQVQSVLVHMLHLDTHSCGQVMDMLALYPRQSSPISDDDEDGEYFDAVETLEDMPPETPEEDIFYDARENFENPVTSTAPAAPPLPPIQSENNEENLSPLSALEKFENIRQMRHSNAPANQTEVSFLLETNARPVMGKVSRFFLRLLGSPQIHWRVSCPISGGEPDLEKAHIRPATSSGNFLWLLFEKRFMATAVKKKTLSLQPQKTRKGHHILQLVH